MGRAKPAASRGDFKPFSVESPAKVNMLLKITGVRPDGRHNLATIFQMIDLCDMVTFRPERSGKILVTCSDKTIPVKKNLAYLAAKALWRPGLPGVEIHVEKRIPSGAGLGGGSSNAACVLSALNKIWGLGLANSSLRRIGARLGADVPFFLFAPRAWATGVGDKLRKLPPMEKIALLLVKPPVDVSTAKAYREFDLNLTTPPKSFRMPPLIKKSGVTLYEAAGLLQNDLEETVLKAHPDLLGVRNELLGVRSKGVMLTGSGSAFFALFKNKKEAVSARLGVARRRPWWSEVASPRISMAKINILKGERNGNNGSRGKTD